ncbi:MAG: hypothetical protein U5K43_04030 [Halofilum sp. (in: g-proteobacteria)]|nr:hypothetical protein [Halofilum sp. (in: g-proteobacteria)]
MSDGPVADDDLSRVVFLNEFEDGPSREEVREHMAQRFKLDAQALDRLFAGPPIVVKKNVDAEIGTTDPVLRGQVSTIQQGTTGSGLTIQQEPWYSVI